MESNPPTEEHTALLVKRALHALSQRVYMANKKQEKAEKEKAEKEAAQAAHKSKIKKNAYFERTEQVPVASVQRSELELERLEVKWCYTLYSYWANLPKDSFADLHRFCTSDIHCEVYANNKKNIDPYGVKQVDPASGYNPEKSPHGAYMYDWVEARGQMQIDRGWKAQKVRANFFRPEKRFLQQVKEALKNVGVDADTLVYSGAGIVSTLNGGGHQLSHLDSPNALEDNKVCFIGFVPLEAEGMILRLDHIRDKDLKRMKEEKKFEPGEKFPKRYTFLFIPQGSMVLLDGGQFHGGHYGSDGSKRFHFFLSNYEMNDDIVFLRQLVGGEDFTGPIPRLPQKKIKFLLNKQKKMAKDSSSVR